MDNTCLSGAGMWRLVIDYKDGKVFRVFKVFKDGKVFRVFKDLRDF